MQEFVKKLGSSFKWYISFVLNDFIILPELYYKNKEKDSFVINVTFLDIAVIQKKNPKYEVALK